MEMTTSGGRCSSLGMIHGKEDAARPVDFVLAMKRHWRFTGMVMIDGFLISPCFVGYTLFLD